VSLKAANAQAVDAIGLERAPPGQKLFFGQLIAAAGFF
jgi:hypothetical protein